MSRHFTLGESARAWRRAMVMGLVAATTAVGCGEAADDAAASRDGEPEALPQTAAAADWCAVKKIMDTNCVACHDGQGTAGAPMGLLKPEDFQAQSPFTPSKKVYETVAARMHDTQRPMPPRGVLPAADLAVIDAWVAAGAPATCGAAPTTPTTPKPAVDAGTTTPADEAWPPAGCDEVYELRSHGAGSAPYSVPAGQEIHPQITLDPPWGSEKVQAIAMKPITDNKKVLHHWILFNGMAFLAGWAPGDDSIRRFPADVGMEMPNGAGSFRLDMHYFNTMAGAKTEQDRSGLAVCVVKGNKLRPKVAAVHMGFMSFGPVLAPANKRGHQATSTCRVTARQPVHLLTAGPHAHKYARHMKFTVRKANGQEIVMHDQKFTFGEQGTYQLSPEVVLETGDSVTTTCTFDNDTNKNITFGESTENEMCFNFATYYPKGALTCGGLGGIGAFGGR